MLYIQYFMKRHNVTIFQQKNNMVFDVIYRRKKTFYKLIDVILTTLFNKLVVGGIIGDLEKDVDWINNDILLLKLELPAKLML